MRLVTVLLDGRPEAGAMVDDRHAVRLRAADPEIPNTVRALLEAGTSMLERARAIAKAPPLGHIVSIGDEAELDVPIRNAKKMLAIGLNYRLHAEETGAPIPEHPIVFAKFPNTLTAPANPLLIPKASSQIDWEGELCVVIGRRGRHIAATDALSYVAGYMNANDVSVRDWQSHAATWTMGKNFDTHLPLGPWILTADEVPDPGDMLLRTWVNNDLKQESSTADLIFDVPTLIEYVSTAMTLEPGDMILTGTPSGVGQARTPPEWLCPGDTVRVEIAGLGSLENPVVAEV